MVDTALAALEQQVPAEGLAPPGAGAAESRRETETLRVLLLALLRELSALEGSRASALPGTKISLREEVRRFEAGLIRCALIRTGGRQRRAARLLGLKVPTLNAKIKRYRIDADRILGEAVALRTRSR